MMFWTQLCLKIRCMICRVFGCDGIEYMKDSYIVHIECKRCGAREKMDLRTDEGLYRLFQYRVGKL